MNENTQQLTDKELALENIKRAYYAPSTDEAVKAETAAKVERVRAIMAAHDLPVAFNWDAANDPLPEGYGIAIIPMKQNRDNQQVLIGAHIAGIPSPDLLLNDENGIKFVHEKIVKACIDKYANSVRDNDNATAPLSLEDFIQNQTRDNGLAFWREIAGDLVKQLKGKGFKTLNNQTLKQILMSASFAAQLFPKVPQGIWEQILNGILLEAKKAGKDEGAIATWLKTRAETSFDVEIDMNDLDSLFN